MCMESDRQSVFGGLTNELQSCSEVSDNDLTSGCADLVKRVSDLRLPRCNLMLSGSSLSFIDAVASIFTECSIAEPQEVPETPTPAESTSSGSSDTTSTVISTMSVPVSGSGSGEARSTSSFSSSSSTSGSELDIEDQDIQKSTTEPASKDLNIQDEAESPTRTPASTRVSATGTVSAISSAGIALVTITAYAMA
uniref:Uncharacterized protein n=1 Tax=Globisporangium ultimum (strain ATCC 200006 / CBS 805.95 / DAOM BR144) TaxID=431595 RepID=K3WZ58_GLOUD